MNNNFAVSEMKQLSYVNRWCKPSDCFPEDCLFALHLVCHHDKHPWHSTHSHRYETQMLHWAVRPPHFHLAPKQLITFVRGVKSVTFPFCSHAWPFHAAAEWDNFLKIIGGYTAKKNEWNCSDWKKALNPAMWRLSFLDANRTNSFRIKSTSFSKEQLFCMLSLNLFFSLSGKLEMDKKLIRLYWKCCTFFIKLIS